MYVCLCHGITDRQIRRAVEQGARSLQDVQTQLPVAGACGCCEQSARELIREQVRERHGVTSERRYCAEADSSADIGYAAGASCG